MPYAKLSRTISIPARFVLEAKISDRKTSAVRASSQCPLYDIRDMKTLRNPKDKEGIIARLQSIRPTSLRRWGKMSAHQMVCHLGDGFRMYLGLKPVSPARLPYPRSLLKWVALWAPIPWPKGFKTVPELDQRVSGTPPVEFDNDVRELRSLVDRFTQQPKDFQWQPHPQFGQMSEKEWMRLGYLHTDHHLPQFGA